MQKLSLSVQATVARSAPDANRTRQARHGMARLTVIGGAAALALAAAGAQAADLRLSHQWSTADVRHEVAAMIADDPAVKEAGIEITIYPSQSLFKAREQYRPLSRGQLDMTVFPLSYAGGERPAYDPTLMPGPVKNHGHAARLNESAFMEEIESIMAEDDVMVLVHGYLAGGFARVAAPRFTQREGPTMAHGLSEARTDAPSGGFSRTVGAISAVCGAVAAGMIVLAVAITCQMIFVRFALNASTIWQTEAVTYLVIGATLVGLPYVQKLRGHVNVDLIAELLPPAGRKALAAFVLLASIAVVGVMFWHGFELFRIAFERGWRMDTVWGPPLWIPYVSMPLGFGLFTLQFAADPWDALSAEGA